MQKYSTESTIINHAQKTVNEWWDRNPNYDFSHFNTARYKDFFMIRCNETDTLKELIGRQTTKEEQMIWEKEFEKIIRQNIQNKKRDNGVTNYAKECAKKYMNELTINLDIFTDDMLVRVSRMNDSDINSFYKALGRRPSEAERTTWSKCFESQIRNLIEIKKCQEKTEIEKEKKIVDHAISYARTWMINNKKSTDFSKFTNTDFMNFSMIVMRSTDKLSFHQTFGRDPNEDELCKWSNEFIKEIRKIIKEINKIKIITSHAISYAKSWMNEIDRDFSTHTETDFYNIAKENSKNFSSISYSYNNYPNEADTVIWCNEFIKEIKRITKETNIQKVVDNAIRLVCPLCDNPLVICIYETGKYEIKCYETYCKWISAISKETINKDLLNQINEYTTKLLESNKIETILAKLTDEERKVLGL